jgi:hypothetical protein
MTPLVILSREDGEGSQNTQLETLRCAQDDEARHPHFTDAYTVRQLGISGTGYLADSA